MKNKDSSTESTKQLQTKARRAHIGMLTSVFRLSPSMSYLRLFEFRTVTLKVDLLLLKTKCVLYKIMPNYFPHSTNESVHILNSKHVVHFVITMVLL